MEVPGESFEDEEGLSFSKACIVRTRSSPPIPRSKGIRILFSRSFFTSSACGGSTSKK
jgi:hypothetical protein